MKTFIVAALLVASVAGQSLDILKLTKEPVNSLLKFDRSVYPTTYNRDLVHDYYNDDTTSIYDYNNVLSLQEIMVHPRFQEYMTLPLFRQYWSYPMFQRYVCSVYFQRFWHIPSFQQYFMSPTLFYKYIYPVVQVFKYDSTTMNTYTSGDWIWNRQHNYPYNYNYNYYGNDVTENVPTVCRYNAVYCKAVVDQLYQHLYYTMMHMPQEDMIVPRYPQYDSMYNPIVSRMMYGNTYNYNKQFPTVNRFQTVQPEVYPYSFDKVYDVPTTTRMMEELTDRKVDQMRPVINRMNVGIKTFDDKDIPQVIKA